MNRAADSPVTVPMGPHIGHPDGYVGPLTRSPPAFRDFHTACTARHPGLCGGHFRASQGYGKPGPGFPVIGQFLHGL